MILSNSTYILDFVVFRLLLYIYTKVVLVYRSLYRALNVIFLYPEILVKAVSDYCEILLSGSDVA